MKEKIDRILGGFLERNREYAIEFYINNAITNNCMGKILITSDRIHNMDDEKFTLKWNKDKNYDVMYNDFSVLYDDIMACFEEVDKNDNLKISETAVIILKNGMEFGFGCVGMKL